MLSRQIWCATAQRKRLRRAYGRGGGQAARSRLRRTGPILGLIGCVLALAGCATVPPPTLSVDEIKSYKLAGVELHNSGAVFSWPAGEQAYLASGKADPDIASRMPNESDRNFPALQAFFEPVLQGRFAAEFNGAVAPLLQGTRPVKAVVHLNYLDVPSGARRIMIQSQARIQADIDLVDAKTNAVLVSYPGLQLQKEIGGDLLGKGAIGGIVSAVTTDLIDKTDPGAALIEAYVSDYAKWLVTR